MPDSPSREPSRARRRPRRSSPRPRSRCRPRRQPPAPPPRPGASATRSRPTCRRRDRRPRRRVAPRRRGRTRAASRSSGGGLGVGLLLPRHRQRAERRQQRPALCARSASSCSRTSGRSPRSRIAPGIWNNFHYGDGTLVDPSDPRFWFESDLYLKLSATWWEVFTTGVTYTYYTSPNDSFTTYADVGLELRPQRLRNGSATSRSIRASCSPSKPRARPWSARRQEGHLHGPRLGPGLHLLHGLLDPR